MKMKRVIFFLGIVAMVGLGVLGDPPRVTLESRPGDVVITLTNWKVVLFTNVPANTPNVTVDIVNKSSIAEVIEEGRRSILDRNRAIGFQIVPAELRWWCATNWKEYGRSRTLMLPESANTTTIHEEGVVKSNLIAAVQWKGGLHSVVLESVFVTNLYRSYIERLERVYKP